MAQKSKTEKTRPPRRTTPKTPAAQRYIPFREIRDGIVMMKDGTLRRVLLVGSLNFALKSQDEQQGIIQGYVSFLNALDFEMQIVIQSRPLNIEQYLKKIDQLMAEQTNELLHEQTASYRAFIETLVTDAKIMEKKFYVVVPYSASSKGQKSFWSRFREVLNPASSVTLSQKTFEKYQLELDRRVSQVINGLSSIGLSSTILDTQSLIELYYNTYNPHSVTSQGLPDIDQMNIDWTTR